MSQELAPQDDFLIALKEAFDSISKPEGSDDERFCEWYMGVLAENEAKRKLIKEQCGKMLAQLDSRDKALQYFRGGEFKKRVEAMIAAAPGGKKSISLLTGDAGKRTVNPRLIVTNYTQVLEWAKENCPDAVEVKYELKLTPLKDYMKSTGEVPPGCEMIGSYQKFYPWIDGAPKLPQGEDNA